MEAGSLTGSASIVSERYPEGARNELEFNFETVNVNLHDTILIPADRDASLEDLDIADLGFVRYSDLFPLEYAGVIPMRFLQRWNDDTMYLENWAYRISEGPKVTMEDIYTILAELDAVVARAPMTREEHAQAMSNMTKMRDFVSYVADQERNVGGDIKANSDIVLGKEKVGV